MALALNFINKALFLVKLNVYRYHKRITHELTQ